MAGAILGKEELNRRLKLGELFTEDSWEPEYLKSAKYDLRIASDWMIIPDHDKKSGEFRKYRSAGPDGRLRRWTDVTLNSGEVALFTSVERFRVPLDVAGQVGVKMRYANKGLLVFTGTTVDPGFGSSVSKPTEANLDLAPGAERLHFLVFNLGTTAVHIKPGVDSIAAVQFFEVSGASSATPVQARDSENQLEAFFQDETQLLVKFGLLEKLATLEQRFDGMQREMNKLTEGTNQIVHFGIFVLSITFLGAMLTNFITVAANANLREDLRTVMAVLPNQWPAAVAFSVLTAASAYVVVSLLTLAVRVVGNGVVASLGVGPRLSSALAGAGLKVGQFIKNGRAGRSS